MKLLTLSFVFPCCCYFLTAWTQAAITDEERIEGHYAKFVWPVREFRPNTEGWSRLMRRRLRQVAEIEDLDRRYEGYAQTMSSALVQPNFTEVRGLVVGSWWTITIFGGFSAKGGVPDT